MLALTLTGVVEVVVVVVGGWLGQSRMLTRHTSTVRTEHFTDPSPAKTGTGTSRVTFFSPVPVPVTPVQLRTTKARKLIISATRIFEGNLTPDLDSDGQKEPENDVFMLFPRHFGWAKFFGKFFQIYTTN